MSSIIGTSRYLEDLKGKSDQIAQECNSQESLIREWERQQLRPFEPNVCFTLTGYFPNWRPTNQLVHSDCQLVRRQFCRFWYKLGIALSPEAFDRRNVENWPPFYAFVEAQARESRRPVPAHAHGAGYLTPIQLARLGDGTGRGDQFNARLLWLTTVGAFRRSHNESYYDAYAREKKNHHLFHLDLNPDENTHLYITKFSGLEENAGESIRRSDLLCLSGH